MENFTITIENTPDSIVLAIHSRGGEVPQHGRFIRSHYVNDLRKFWRKNLAYMKKPTKRKRLIVDQYVFATMAKQLPNGVCKSNSRFNSMGKEYSYIVFDELNENQQQLDTQ